MARIEAPSSFQTKLMTCVPNKDPSRDQEAFTWTAVEETVGARLIGRGSIRTILGRARSAAVARGGGGEPKHRTPIGLRAEVVFTSATWRKLREVIYE